MTHRSRGCGGLGATAVVLLAGGCPPPQDRPVPTIQPSVPIWRAIQHVNDNAKRIGGTLRATGVVDGHLTDDEGKRRTFHVDGVLFFLSPRDLRFDLKKLGDRQVLLGSNEVDYWVYTKHADEWFCGPHGVASDLPQDVPVRPDQFVEALGLNPIRLEPVGDTSHGPIQRVTETAQQLLFYEEDSYGGSYITRELWLDRAAPRLIRRILFRDSYGRVEMDARLDDFAPLTAGGAWLPGVMTAEWPASGARLQFRINQWKRFDEVTSEAVQFRTPQECERLP